MSPNLLREPPLTPAAEPGPYRRGDYDRLSGEPRCELILGRLYVSPSPSVLHQVVVLLLGRLLDAAASSAGGLALVAPIDVVLAEHTVVQPDVLYLSAARRGLAGERIEGAPDLVVEVLSAGTVRRDRGEKLVLYAQAGVREVWLVDPAERQIEHLVNEGGRFLVCLPVDGAYRSPALPELRLDVAGFWRELTARLPGA